MIENIQEYTTQIRRMVSDRLDLTRTLQDEEVREVIAEVVQEGSRRHFMSLGEKKQIMEMVFNSMRGLDVLQPL